MTQIQGEPTTSLLLFYLYNNIAQLFIWQMPSPAAQWAENRNI